MVDTMKRLIVLVPDDEVEHYIYYIHKKTGLKVYKGLDNVE